MAKTIFREFLQREHRLLIAAVLLGIASSVLRMLLTISVGRFYDLVFHTHGSKDRVLQLFHFTMGDTLQTFFAFYFSVVALRFIFNWADVYLREICGEKLSRHFREKLFYHQLHTPLPVFMQRAPGKYLLRYSGDLQALQKYLVTGMIAFAADCVVVTIGIGFLFFLQPALTLMLVLAIPVFLIVFSHLNKQLKKRAAAKRGAQSALLAFVSQRFYAMEAVKVFRKEPIENKRFRKRSARLYSASKQYHRQNGFMQAVSPLLLFCLLGFFLWLVQQDAARFAGHTGQLFSYMLLLMFLFSFFRKLLRAGASWQLGQLSLERIEVLLTASRPLPEAPKKGLQAITHFEWKSAMMQDGATGDAFTLSFQEGAINFFSADAEITQAFVAFLSGRTPAATGCLFINGEAATSFTHTSVWRLAALATDTLPVYGHTVYEYVVRGKKKKASQKLQTLIGELGISDSIALTQPIGHHGKNLSRQQLHLLLLLRALCSDCPYLVLDEPFTYTDTLTAAKIYKYLQQQIPKKTIIILERVKPKNRLLHPGTKHSLLN